MVFELTETFTGLLSVLVSLAAALISVIFALRAQRTQKLTSDVEVASWRRGYIAQIRVWAGEASDCLADAVHLAELDPARTSDPSFFDRRQTIRSRLSSLADRGRWHFPNLQHDAYGNDKPPAFRGFRDPLLDALVEGYDVVTSLNYLEQAENRQAKDRLVEIKRDFVSAVQQIIDPWGENEEFRRFTRIAALHQRPTR
ncbi:MAG: hypothetical protein AAGC81_01690 [Pseudomonadota bacterium]